MKIEILLIEKRKTLKLTAETQAEHYQIIALSDADELALTRIDTPYFSVHISLKE